MKYILKFVDSYEKATFEFGDFDEMTTFMEVALKNCTDKGMTIEIGAVKDGGVKNEV